MGFARRDKFVQNVTVPPVHMPSVTLEISFSLMCAVESSSCSLCLHNWFAPKNFVFFDIAAKKENAVEMWEETPSVFLFVEQVRVSEELSFG